MANSDAFPLRWPEGWPRYSSRLQGSYFGSHARPLTFDRARSSLTQELKRLGAAGVVLSTNIPLRQDGLPHADWARRRMDDPGVAIYFTLKGKQMVMAQDRYTDIANNMRSLALAIEGMRQLNRHGGGHMMERAFAGFSALPPPDGAKPSRPWWQTFDYPADPSALIAIADVEARFRRLARERHPDNAGGSTDAMAELNLAMEAARQVFR